MRKAKYSQAQIDRACELREDGKTYGQIARMTGMNASSVISHCMIRGAMSDHPLRARVPATVRYRHGKVVRPFTADEDEQMLAMNVAGAKLSEISRALKRARTSVKNRLVALAYRDAKEEVA